MSESMHANTRPAIGENASLGAWLVLIVCGTILGAIVGFAVSSITPATYSASVTMLVAPKAGPDGITNDKLQIAQGLTSTLAELATTSLALQRVIESADADVNVVELAKSVGIRVPAGTSLISITVTDTDPAQAATLANGIALELQRMVPEGNQTTPTAMPVNLTIVDPATEPTVPNGLDPLASAALGGAVGLFVAISGVFLVENLWPSRSRWEAREDETAGA